jgi:tetratricopeptide (TPR) repeat protein
MADQTWTEVRSPNFRVITDGSGKDARTVANEFERMRHLFAVRFNNEALSSGPPLTIVAVRDFTTLRTLDPSTWKSRGDNASGEFLHGWERQFAIIRLDTWTENNRVSVNYEYTQAILRANTHWLPLWLNVGFCEFYAYTRFDKDHIYIGAPSPRLGVLQNQSLLPISTMLDVNARSPRYNDAKEIQIFFVEAWAIVHYMTFGPSMGNGDKLSKFFQLLHEGVAQQKAFHDVFGDPKAFDESFFRYLQRSGFTAAQLPPDLTADPKSFSERKLTTAEIEYEIGCVQIRDHDFTDARTSIEKSLALDPNLAAAHEELGFLNFEAGKNDEAEKEWKQAISLDPSLGRSLFALTMSGPFSAKPMTAQSPDELHTAQVTLQHVTQLAPRYAPAYVELAVIEWQQGSLQQAYKDAHQAEALEPSRAGYHLLTGHILLHGKQAPVAASYSRYVATHWFGSDHDEAVDLWQAVPVDQRGDGPPLTLDVPTGADVVRGKLTEVSCDASREKITFLPDKPDATPLTLTTKGRFRIGFSDTLWWGEDHFSCHHLAGHTAVALYKADATKGPQVLELEIRDDLPDDK